MSAKNSIPSLRRSREPSRSQNAGEDWGGNEFRERLRELILKSSNGNLAAFARHCDLHATRVSGWLAGKQLPSLKHIAKIARKTGVSVDWLLDGRNNRGEPSATPVNRGEIFELSTVEEKVAHTVFHLLPPDQRRIFHPRFINVPNIIKIAAEKVSEHLSAHADIIVRSQEYGRDGQDLTEILKLALDTKPELRTKAKNVMTRFFTEKPGELFPIPSSPYVYSPPLPQTKR